jgi:voltage-gated potassium channel Kch
MSCCQLFIKCWIVILLLFIIVDTILIQQGHTNIDPKGDENSLVNGTYFATTTLSTVGYGDILPTTNLGKLCVGLQHMIVMALGFGILVSSC